MRDGSKADDRLIRSGISTDSLAIISIWSPVRSCTKEQGGVPFTPGFRSLSEKVLRGSLCKLRASVVNVFPGNFTTETRSITEFAQRNSFFRQTPKGGTPNPGSLYNEALSGAECL